jgi:nucleoside-triphosphatase THEP1
MSGKAQSPTIFLVTASVQGGKTTFLSGLIGLLKKRGLKVEGFLCPGSLDAGKRSGFKLKNIGSGKELVMASTRETAGWIPYGRFWFDPKAFVQGRKWIQACLTQEPDVVVVDEVGPMELEGLGWSESLERIIGASIPVQVWSVRERLLGEILHRWDIPAEHVIRIEEIEISQAAEQIINRAI